MGKCSGRARVLVGKCSGRARVLVGKCSGRAGGSKVGPGPIKDKLTLECYSLRHALVDILLRIPSD